MKNLILALMLTTMASSVFASTVTVENHGWYASYVRIVDKGDTNTRLYWKTILLGGSHTFEVGDDWEGYAIIDGKPSDVNNRDLIIEFSNSGDATYELHGTVISPHLWDKTEGREESEVQ